MQAITRKFLVKDIPNLSQLHKTSYSRFYLYASDKTVIRIQQVGNEYELERKVDKPDLVREGLKIPITEKEFNALSSLTKKHIVRDSYSISDKPSIVLRVYHGEYEGLARAEITFDSVEEAQKFNPLDWFEKEISNSPLAKDGTLLNLSAEDFNKLLT